jgi:RNA recognition motif-containing protein
MATSIYVGNLPTSATEAGLRAMFSAAGAVGALRAIRDFAYIDYADEGAAQRAVELFNGRTLDGSVITVSQAGPGAPGGRRGRPRR